MLQKAFGDLTMSQKNVYKWYKDFKEGRELVDDLEHPGRPSTSTDEQHVNQIKELVLSGRDTVTFIRLKVTEILMFFIKLSTRRKVNLDGYSNNRSVLRSSRSGRKQ